MHIQKQHRPKELSAMMEMLHLWDALHGSH